MPNLRLNSASVHLVTNHLHITCLAFDLGRIYARVQWRANMNIDLLQVMTNLTVAALTAWFSSKVALRQGIERARKEKAFERRLEWYEKAARAAMDFRQFNEEFALLLRKDDVEGLEKMVSGHLQLTSSMQRTINESIFFADKITYVQLKRVFKEFQS